MKHYELSGTGGDVYFPNEICVTRGEGAYVRFTASKSFNILHPRVTLRVVHGETSVALVRLVPRAGASVVFPLTAILEATKPEDSKPYFTDVNLEVSYGTGTASHRLSVVHVGTCDREVQPLSAQEAAGETGTNYPFARKIAVYPAFSTTQYLYAPKVGGQTAQIKTAEGALVGVVEEGTPFAAFAPSRMLWDGKPMLCISIYNKLSINPLANLSCPVLVDLCTEGVFLRWVDMSGMPYLYRWSREVETHSVEAEATYTRLDDTLTPYEIQTKTLERRYTLHSRIVERDIYEMCRTILAAQEIWMYDAALRDWTRCYIDDAEAEDSGAEMQDLTIEVVKNTYNL